MLSIKISRLNIRPFILVLILFMGLFRVYFFSAQIFKIYSMLLLTPLLLICIRDVNRIKRNKYILLFVVCLCFSTIINHRSITGVFNALFYAVQFLTLFFVADYITCKYGLVGVFRSFWQVSMLITTLMDISVLIGMDLDLSHYQNLITYLFGNKFYVSYFHMQTLAILAGVMWVENRKRIQRQRVYYTLYAIYSIAMCAFVNCSTGVIGNFAVWILMILPLRNRIKAIFSNPLIMFGIMFIGNLLLLGNKFLLEIPFVQYIITEVLHEDLTLTGRFLIYDMLIQVIESKPIWGYGYNTDIITRLLGYGNAQNGFLQSLLDCGIVGSLFFFINWYNCITNARKDYKKVWPIVCLVYAFIVCSLVEVCFKFSFMIALALLQCVQIDKGLRKRRVINESRHYDDAQNS